ncbi:MAG: hypothetical protein ACRD5K_05750 [Candidatus Acidiferrales bacterium]
MIKLAGALVLALAFAVSAQAQSARGGAHFSVSPSSYSVGGGGSGGGLSSGGSHILPHFAPRRFAVRDASGSAADYIPSTFVAYTAALREGQAALSAHPSPLGTLAHASIKLSKESAKIDVVQGQNGKPAIQTR